MKKVYVCTTGEYSDTTIEKVVATKEQADQFVQEQILGLYNYYLENFQRWKSNICSSRRFATECYFLAKRDSPIRDLPVSIEVFKFYNEHHIDAKYTECDFEDCPDFIKIEE